MSYSSCRAVPIDPTRACQPEIAPQAIVTKSIGQSGCQAFPAAGAAKPRSLTAVRAKVPMTFPPESITPVRGATNIPTAERTIVISMIQKPM